MNRKFIKKPLEIEAFCFGHDIIPRWGESGEIKYFMHHAIISTLEGDMTANQGDYIIKGIKGELYPCKADVFEASYDEVNQPYIAKSDPEEDLPDFSRPSILIPVSDVTERMSMNDFTKEELKCLANAIELQLSNISMSQINYDKRKELLNKIKSMIDNYCDHNWQKGEHLFTDTFCTKCHKSLNDEGDKEPIND